MPGLAHFGIGLAAKRFTPKIPLWALLIAAMFIDILSFIFTSAVWISHGLFMSVIWSIIAMIITALITFYLNSKKEENKGTKSLNWRNVNFHITMVMGLIVFSHWILDFIGWPMTFIGLNDIGTPLLFNDAVNIGLGVYTTWLGALSMDIGVFAVGLTLYILYLKKVKK
ncbi:MAG: hypothetical protein ACFE92_17400 [Promethearchaeota archaeon]